VTVGSGARASSRTAPAGPPPSPSGTVAGALRGQRAFVIAVAVVAVARFVLPPGRVPGAQETWLTVAALWALGIVWVAVGESGRRALGECVGDLGAQNLAIQGLIVLPSVVVGLVRMMQTGTATAAAFPANALVAIAFLPLASVVILTLAGLVPLGVLQRLRAAIWRQL